MRMEPKLRKPKPKRRHAKTMEEAGLCGEDGDEWDEAIVNVDNIGPSATREMMNAYDEWEPVKNPHGHYPSIRRLTLDGLAEEGYCAISEG